MRQGEGTFGNMDCRHGSRSVGVTAARREVTIQSAWDRAIAVHPFAVHFCSIKQGQLYGGTIRTWLCCGRKDRWADSSGRNPGWKKRPAVQSITV